MTFDPTEQIPFYGGEPSAMGCPACPLGGSGGSAGRVPTSERGRTGSPHLDLLRTIESKYLKRGAKSIKCPQPVGVWIKFDANKKKHYDKFQYCGKWTCPHCGVVKRARLLERIKIGFTGYRVRLWTLTIKHGHDDDGKIMRAFHRLLMVLQWRGYIPRYVWFKQFTRNHTRHLHILISDEKYASMSIHDLSINDLQTLWYEATERTSFIVDTGKPTFDLNFPAGYASRYMTREFQQGFDRREHRFGTSRGFPQLKKGVMSPEWILEII